MKQASTSLTIKVTTGLRDTLDGIAAQQGVSMSHIVREVIYAHYGAAGSPLRGRGRVPQPANDLGAQRAPQARLDNGG